MKIKSEAMKRAKKVRNHKINKEYHPSDTHKDIGNRLMGKTSSGTFGEGDYKRSPALESFMSMNPSDRRRVSTHMGRLHRRKNK